MPTAILPPGFRRVHPALPQLVSYPVGCSQQPELYRFAVLVIETFGL